MLDGTFIKALLANIFFSADYSNPPTSPYKKTPVHVRQSSVRVNGDVVRVIHYRNLLYIKILLLIFKTTDSESAII